MSQKQLDPHSEFGPAQTAPQTGNKKAAEMAAKKLSVRLRDLPTKKERLLALADMIENAELAKQDIGFNMGTFYSENELAKSQGYFDKTGHECGTVACIAGWAVLSDNGNKPIDDSYSLRAREILGFTHEEVAYFFSGAFSALTLDRISDTAAIAALRDYAHTGEMKPNAFKNDGTIKKS